MAWAEEFNREHDPTGLFCESNVFRYQPVERAAVRLEPGQPDRSLHRVLAAAEQCKVPVVVSTHENETATAFAERLPELGVSRLRVIGKVDPSIRAVANRLGLHIADDPVTSNGRVELLHYLKEQSVSRTLHRYGNLL